MGNWWFRQEYLCEFVATTDQVFAYDLVTGARPVEVARRTRHRRPAGTRLYS